MRLLPLGISAVAASWRIEASVHVLKQAQAAFQRDNRTCRFCGLGCGEWAEPFHHNGDHTDYGHENIVCACPTCHACQHLGSESADQEHVVVWLPHLTQAALNHLVCGIHSVFHTEGQSPALGERPTKDTPALRSAYTAYQELASCAASVQAGLGSASPRFLGEVLLTLPQSASSRIGSLTDGLRLLSQGRLLRNGRDVYPDFIDVWTTPVRT